jgi:hypothetical protein
MATTTQRHTPRFTLEVAHQELVPGVEAMTTSTQWMEYRSVVARFTHYSANSTFLILVQRPDATRVAGFRTWKSLGGSVKKGAKGIANFCPCVRRSAGHETEDNRSSTTNRLVGFRIGYVLDVADTEGADLPDGGLTVRHPVGLPPKACGTPWSSGWKRPASPSPARRKAMPPWGRPGGGQTSVTAQSRSRARLIRLGPARRWPTSWPTSCSTAMVAMTTEGRSKWRPSRWPSWCRPPGD